MATNTNVLSERITYSVCINSSNKIAGGLNNNCSFYIPWVTVLPQCYDNYKVVFNLQTTGGNYKDNTTTTYTSAKLFCDFGSRSYQYDTNTVGPSNSMGVITRDIQSSTTTSNTFSAFFYQNVSKTITRPTNNQLNIQIINNATNGPLYNTDTSAQSIPTTDMTAWVLYLEFIPVANETRVISSRVN